MRPNPTTPTAAPALTLTAAEAWIGTPWHAAAATRGAGCDCTGLLRGVIRDVAGRDIPAAPWTGGDRSADLLASCRANLISVPVAEAAPSHIVTFRRGTRRAAHCGILTPGGILHAAEGLGVFQDTAIPGTAITSAWAIPAALGATAPPALTAADILGVIAPAGAVITRSLAGSWAEFTDQRDATPIGRARFPSTQAALEYLAPWGIDLEVI